jgi:hypothetical protein
MTYFHMGNPHYHRRGVVSLSCSEWEGVGPTRYGRQTNCSACSDTLLFALFVVRCLGFDTSSTNGIFGRSKVFMCSDCCETPINLML